MNNVTVPRTLDDEMGWICAVLSAGADEGTAMAPSEALTHEFVQWIADEIPRTVWADGCVNWYQGSGKIPVIWPWYDQEQTEMFRDSASSGSTRAPPPEGRRQRQRLTSALRRAVGAAQGGHDERVVLGGLVGNTFTIACEPWN